MGQSSSNLVKKLSSPFSGWGGSHSAHSDKTLAVTPFVYSRQGSMYFDEDGDLAHEFYEEVMRGQSKGQMIQHWNIIPQGEVELPHPRLHTDFPIVICETPR